MLIRAEIEEHVVVGPANKSWRDLLSSAKEKTEELTSDPRARTAVDKAKSGAARAASTLDGTRRKITQEEAWAETSEILSELVDVVLVQQRVLEALSDQVAQLSEAHSGRDGG